MVTSLYAAILAVIYIMLTVNTILTRKKHWQALGNGDNFEVLRAIRAHGNFMEYTPLFLIMLILTEMNNLSAFFVHLLGVVFVIGRLIHAYSILKSEQYDDKGVIKAPPKWRVVGMGCTINTIGIMALILVIQFVMDIL